VDFDLAVRQCGRESGRALFGDRAAEFDAQTFEPAHAMQLAEPAIGYGRVSDLELAKLASGRDMLEGGISEALLVNGK
jgi:hypothetical protein